MSAPAKDGPKLAGMVRAGEQQKEAIRIAEGVWRVHDLSSAYLVNTSDGDVMINTGFMDNVARNKALFDPVRTGPLRAIILTQSHPDHFGGVPAFKEAETKVYAERRFVQNWADYRALMPFYGRRSRRLWASTIKRDAAPPPPPDVVPDVAVAERTAIEIGGRRFELIPMGAGETTDTLAVFMPKEKIAFVGNIFGPVFLSMPFLVTLRGEKPRLVQNWLPAVEAVRALGAEVLLSGHSEPVVGAARIAADLTTLHDAVAFIRDETIAGMNAGKDVGTLMREIVLPERLRIGEYHGKVSWGVRSIWEEFAGWFYFDRTTALYPVARASVDADLAELA
ncbi:MAG: MBL fold metallo-hydrolase, partial [Parvularculaceae bacterium]|nr:MBL fold metallo-hydrolase [Parvularculaceae bacterium]